MLATHAYFQPQLFYLIKALKVVNKSLVISFFFRKTDWWSSALKLSWIFNLEICWNSPGIPTAINCSKLLSQVGIKLFQLVWDCNGLPVCLPNFPATCAHPYLCTHCTRPVFLERLDSRLEGYPFAYLPDISPEYMVHKGIFVTTKAELLMIEVLVAWMTLSSLHCCVKKIICQLCQFLLILNTYGLYNYD